MLCQYTVKNFKSIKNEMTLDMQATAISEHEDRIIRCPDGEKFLPVCAIYGPNGGGKSNLIESMFALKSKIARPVLAIKKDSLNLEDLIKPYAFCEDVEPTEFKIFFRTEISEYRYIIKVLNEEIIEESLSQIKFETGRASDLFIRNKDKCETKGALSKLKVAEIAAKLPLLSYLGIIYSDNEIVKDVIDWILFDYTVLNYGNSKLEREIIYFNDFDKKLKLKILKAMDVDIVDYRIEETGNAKRIYTTHTVDGYSKEISIYDESSGTRKIFGMVTFIADSITNGRTLLIDELDAKLHPLLTKYLIDLYLNPKINKKGAQLIFTSHDVVSMNKETFRRDEIWFVAKGNKQDSQLYSLVEFKDKDGKSVRNDATFNKQYLEGKYGADPYLRRIINWEANNG